MVTIWVANKLECGFQARVLSLLWGIRVFPRLFILLCNKHKP